MPSPFSTKGCDANGRWSRPPDGFSYLWPAQNAYQFVPVGQSRALSLKTDHRPWTLTAVDLTMSGGIDVRLNARKTVIGPFQTYALEPGMKYPLDLIGNAEAALALVMSTPGEADKPLLYAHGGRWRCWLRGVGAGKPAVLGDSAHHARHQQRCNE